MQQWFIIILGSVLSGVLCAWQFEGRRGFLLAGGLPWCALLAWLLYHEYFVPYQSGGASMWPIALLWAGSIATAIGCGTYALLRRAFRNVA